MNHLPSSQFKAKNLPLSWVIYILCIIKKRVCLSSSVKWVFRALRYQDLVSPKQYP